MDQFCRNPPYLLYLRDLFAGFGKLVREFPQVFAGTSCIRIAGHRGTTKLVMSGPDYLRPLKWSYWDPWARKDPILASFLECVIRPCITAMQPITFSDAYILFLFGLDPESFPRSSHCRNPHEFAGKCWLHRVCVRLYLLACLPSVAHALLQQDALMMTEETVLDVHTEIVRAEQQQHDAFDADRAESLHRLYTFLEWTHFLRQLRRNNTASPISQPESLQSLSRCTFWRALLDFDSASSERSARSLQEIIEALPLPHVLKQYLLYV